MASVNGGVEIEEVAKTDPASIIVEPINIDEGLTDVVGNKIVDALKL